MIYIHDDVIKWKHFPCYWPFVRGIHRSPVNSPHKGQWRGVLMCFFICAWTNGWVNTRYAVDWRRHRAHYDVNLMHCDGNDRTKITLNSPNHPVTHPYYGESIVRIVEDINPLNNEFALYIVVSYNVEACDLPITMWPSLKTLLSFFSLMKFSGVITIDRRDVRAKGEGQRSKVKVTEVMTPFSRFRTVTPVWIHIWRRNDALSLMLLRKKGTQFFKVVRQISRSHGWKKKSSIFTQIMRFRTVTPVGIHHWLWNNAQRLKQHRRCVLLFFKVTRQFSMPRRTKNRQFLPDLRVSRP